MATPSLNSTLFPARAGTRPSGVRIPTRFNGSAPLSATSSSPFSSLRTARSLPTASAAANCSPPKPATKRPPRISPRASRRRYTFTRSRHGLHVREIVKGEERPTTRALHESVSFVLRREQRAQSAEAVRRHQTGADQLGKPALDERRQQVGRRDELVEEQGAPVLEGLPYRARLR